MSRKGAADIDSIMRLGASVTRSVNQRDYTTAVMSIPVSAILWSYSPGPLWCGGIHHMCFCHDCGTSFCMFLIVEMISRLIAEYLRKGFVIYNMKRSPHPSTNSRIRTSAIATGSFNIVA